MFVSGEEKWESEQPIIGLKLEQARNERKLSLEDVERAIKIHAHHLETVLQ